jgi:hypothetical protein
MLEAVQLHLSGEIDRTLEFRFLPLSEDDRKAEAEVRKMAADTYAVFVDRGIVASEEVRGLLADDPKSGFDNLDGELPDEGGEGYGGLRLVPAPGGEPAEASGGPAEASGKAQPEAAREEESVQQQALNGAQVASLLEIVKMAAAKQLPRDACVGIIKASFPLLTESQVNEVLGSAGTDRFVPPLPEGGGAAQ